ncbi:MAG: VOC family protein [candidate division NC10 bacterium]|nr:VOC family protein [candidate division NC10 bacterium]
MVKVKGLHHVGIITVDLDKAMEFYGKVLGLPTLPRPDLGFPGAWYALGAGQELHLMVLGETITPSRRHIALEVEDLEETMKTLKEEGVRIRGEPIMRHDGSRTLFCYDPDGNLLEITHHPS